MSEIPSRPAPAAVPPSDLSRRIYFERLTAALLASGLSGSRIGLIVTELDQHVAMSGTDPVSELGPAGELADALAAADSDRTPWRWLLGNVALGALAGALLALIFALFSGTQSDNKVTVDLGIVANLGVFMIGVGLLHLFGSKSLIGKSTFELPAMKYTLPYFAGVMTVAVLTQGLEWSTTTGVAWALLAVAVPLTALAAAWSIRRSRIPIPGNVRHLRRLGWGLFGR